MEEDCVQFLFTQIKAKIKNEKFTLKLWASLRWHISVQLVFKGMCPKIVAGVGLQKKITKNFISLYVLNTWES